MMLKLSASLILLAGLVAISVSGSAIKGHHQAQPVQRAEELPKGALKSPVSQQTERNPKSAPVAGHPATPVLESSKKVYNDVSFRRSVGQQQQAGDQQQAQPQSAFVAKSSPVVEPAVSAQQPPVVVAPVQSAPVVVKEVVVPQESPKVAPAPVLAPAPVESVVKPVEVPAAPVNKPGDELPPQSDRSAPVKDELKPQVANSSPVAVEQVESVAKVAVVPQQQAPVVAPVESKPVAPVVQPAPNVVAPVQSQPESVVEPLKSAPVDSSLQAKKDEPAAAPAKESSEPIEVPAPDPGLVLSEPIDSTTKLLIDLDEHVQKFLPTEDKQEPAQPAKDAVLVQGVDYSPVQPQVSESQPSGKSSVPLMPYSSNVESEPIVPPLPASLDKVEKASGAQSALPSTTNAANGQSATRQANHQHQNQQQVINQLLEQLDSLQNRIQDTINQLVARRRYVMSALLRPMGTYVRRVRTNLERLQNRVNQLQSAASSVGGNPNNRPGGLVDAAAIETIRRRIEDISKRTGDIMNRIRFSLTPTSAPLNNNGRK